jgi:tyrosine-protein kinase Etk/Wzc
MQSRQNKTQQQQKEDNQLSQALAGYISYWPLFLICLLLASGAAFFYIRYSIPRFEANATVIIKDEKKGSDDSQLLQSLAMIDTKKIIENETEVFQSRRLMSEVVKKLRLYAGIKMEGKLKYHSAYLYCPVIIEVKNPDSIKEELDIRLSYNDKNKMVTLSDDSAKFTGGLDQWHNTHFGVLRFLANPKYRQPDEVRPYYLDLIQVKNITEDILASLKVSPSSKLSSVLELSYVDQVPQKAEDILNTLIAYYNDASIAEKNKLVRNTLESIDSRLSVVANDLDSIEKKIQQYRASNKATDLSVQSKIYLEGVSGSDAKLSEVQVQLSNLDQLEKSVTTKDNIGVLPSGLGVNDPALTQLMTNLSAAQINYDKLKKTVGENNPMLLSIKDEINKLKPDIISNIRVQKRNLDATRQSLASTSGKYGSMLNYIPQQEKQLLEISRDQNIKSGIYSFLLQKREETQLSYASNISDSKIVNYALAGKNPVSPKKSLIYFAALILGLLTPVALVGAKELFNNKVLYRKEIETLTSIPVIGEIVHNKSNAPVVIEAGKKSFIAEEFRKIRVSLLFLGIDSYHKKILVTSSIPGEGKSFIAANLAISLAMTGKKVALVDMDLHSPSLGTVFNMPSDDPGVSDFLLGEKEAGDIIIKIPSHENLFFIPAGGLHPTPSELLENGQIQKLIKYLDDSFDMVVLDTAPVVMVTDAYHLSSLADATLYVIRHKYTPKMLVKRIDENNKVNTLKNPAILFNAVKNRGFMKNNYGYGYDYVYGGSQKKMKGNKVKA